MITDHGDDIVSQKYHTTEKQKTNNTPVKLESLNSTHSDYEQMHIIYNMSSKNAY